jgi:hypothetical protein
MPGAVGPYAPLPWPLKVTRLASDELKLTILGIDFPGKRTDQERDRAEHGTANDGEGR